PPPPPPQLPTLSIGDAVVVEGDTAAVTVTLSSPSDSTVTVSFASADGTATAVGGDYDPVSGTLSFAPGETEKTILVRTNSDDLEEGTEFLNLELTGPTNAVIGDGNGIVEITDDFTPAPPPTISIGDVTVIEGQTAQFTLTLSSPVDT
ncbi:MAG TPA: sodium:calcium exchanger, partial [Halieaceae bacterium]|nr:sodium:calcium exchanger [Halieaceae bacterium]